MIKNMKLNAVGVSSNDIQKTVSFYKLLGFKFPEFKSEEKHIESIASNGSAKLMIDAKEVIKEIIGESPEPGNHSSFAIQYDDPEKVNVVAQKIGEAGFKVVKAPWDAFWGQRYAIVEDPDGYKVDLYATLS